MIGLIGFNLLKNTGGICSKTCRHHCLRNKTLAFFNKNCELTRVTWTGKYSRRNTSNANNSGLFTFGSGRTRLVSTVCDAQAAWPILPERTVGARRWRCVRWLKETERGGHRGQDDCILESSRKKLILSLRKLHFEHLLIIYRENCIKDGQIWPLALKRWCSQEMWRVSQEGTVISTVVHVLNFSIG